MAVRLLKNSKIKSKKSRDRALMYHNLASTYGWAIEEIENAPADILQEMAIVIETLAEPMPKKVKKQTK